jgi:hypothetical protein
MKKEGMSVKKAIEKLNNRVIYIKEKIAATNKS